MKTIEKEPFSLYSQKVSVRCASACREHPEITRQTRQTEARRTLTFAQPYFCLRHRTFYGFWLKMAQFRFAISDIGQRQRMP